MEVVSITRQTRNNAKQAQNRRIRSGNTQPTTDWQCPSCHNWYINRYGGARRHWNNCPVRQAALVEAKRARRRGAGSSLPAEIRSEYSGSGSPSQVRSESPGSANEDPAGGSPQDPMDFSPGRPPSRPNSPSFDPYTVRLDPGETLIIPHPHSRKKPYIISAASESLEGIMVKVPEDSPSPETEDNALPPWHPFKTLEDFEQAEIFVNYNCSDSHINRQLKMDARISTHGQITLKSAAEFHALLEHGGQLENLTDFLTVTLKVPYQHSGKEEDRSYIFRYKPCLDPILHVMEDPALQDILHLYPEMHFVRRSGPGGGNMRVYSDVHTGDDWHELQTTVGEHNVVIYLIYYSDATQLNSFGTKKAWSVYMWVGNVPKEHRQSRGKGRAILLGFLPEVTGLKDDDSSALATHRARVFHAALAHIFNSCKTAAQVGVRFATSSGSKNGIPTIATVSTDYEEKTKCCLVLGPHSKHPCCNGLGKKEDQWSLDSICTPRTIQGTEDVRTAANLQLTAAARKETLAKLSIRNIQNAFTMIFGFFWSVYKALTSDPLHEIEQGEFGKHIWPWITSADMLFRHMLDELDGFFQSLSPFPKVHHFPNGVTSLKYISAREHNTILRYLAPMICDMRPDLDPLLLPLLRRLSCILLLARLKVHTDDTLALLEDHIKHYNDVAVKIREADLGIDFNWPKHHAIIKHLVESVRKKGAVDNASTDIGEALHPQTKVDWDGTNHQPATAQDQMLRKARERDVVMHIRDRIDCALHKGDIVDDTTRTIPTQRVKIGSRQKTIQVHAFQAQVNEEHDYASFQPDLLAFLQQHVDPNLRDISICRITPHRSVRVSYVCEVTTTLQSDILHVSPCWRKEGPRYDTALIQGHTPTAVVWAEILNIFGIRLVDRTLEIALVHEFESMGRHRQSGYIELKKASHFSFVFVDSIIRANHVILPTWSSTRFTVQDLQDGDMYLRLIRAK